MGRSTRDIPTNPNSDYAGWHVGIVATVVAGGLATLTLAAMLALSVYTRFTADDFGWIGGVRMLGFWRAQRFWFDTGSGRISATAIQSLLQELGPRMAWLAPVLSIGLLTIGTALLLENFIQGPAWRSRAIRLSLAAVMVAITILSTPSFQQDVFWQSAVVIYTMPLGLAPVVLWAILKIDQAAAGWVAKIVCFATGILLAGFSETSTAVLLAGGAALLVWRWNQRKHLLAVFWLVCGLVVGFMVMAAAPGNPVRYAALLRFAAIHRLGGRSPLSSSNTMVLTVAYLLYRLVRFYPALAAVAVFAPMAVARATPDGPSPGTVAPRRVAGLLLRAMVFFGLACASVIPAVVVLGQRPPDRVLLWTEVVIVFAISYLGWLVGGAIPPRTASVLRNGIAIALCLAAVLGFAGSIRGFWSLRPRGQAFARTWDRTDALIRQAVAAGQQDVVVPSTNTDFSHVYVAPTLLRPGVANGDELSIHPNHWLNQVVAAYYGCKTIRVESSGGDPWREENEPLIVPFPHN